MPIEEGARLSGWFDIPNDRRVLGSLTLNGSNTQLYVHDPEFFHTTSPEHGHLLGTLHDLTRVSLFDCITTSGPGSASSGNEGYTFAELFPHFVVYGARHLGAHEAAISRVSFTIDDADVLFHDAEAFGQVSEPSKLIERVVNRDHAHEEPPFGPNPLIAYFAGRTELLSAATTIGTVTASHRPVRINSSPKRVAIENQTYLTIDPNEPIDLSDAISRVLRLLQFLELLIGRPQNISNLGLRLRASKEGGDYLGVYWCMPPFRSAEAEHPRPGPYEMLIDPIRSRAEFETVLSSWLARDGERRDARERFSDAFELQRRYTIDRLVGAANMFDILPIDAVPGKVCLSKGLVDAKSAARHIFRGLPASPERDSVLGALGRLGISTLRDKVQHRARLLTERAPGMFPRLDEMVAEAVRCRNHYVHGSPGSFSYAANSDMVATLTNILEFIFGASELVEAGWNIEQWSSRGSSGRHPFGALKTAYPQHLSRLDELLGASVSESDG